MRFLGGESDGHIEPDQVPDARLIEFGHAATGSQRFSQAVES